MNLSRSVSTRLSRREDLCLVPRLRVRYVRVGGFRVSNAYQDVLSLPNRRTLNLSCRDLKSGYWDMIYGVDYTWRTE